MNTFAARNIAEAGRHVALAAAALRDRTVRTLNLSRLMSGMGNEHLDGYELERCQENAIQAGKPFDRQRVILRWEDIAVRDLTAGTGSAGGYLSGTDVAAPEDILRPFSVVAKAGITVLPNLQNNVDIPKESVVSTAAWQANEGATITASAPTLAAVLMSPKTVGDVVNFSRQLRLQTDIEGFLRRSLLRTVATAIDKAVLNGSGGSGQPLGLMGTTGIGTQSGTSLNHAGTLAMKAAAAAANAPDDYFAWIATPAVRQILEGRERATGSGFIWDRDMVAGRPAFSTTDLPAGALVCGPFDKIVLGLWGPGFEFEVNPYAAFTTGGLAARVFVSCDVGVVHPGAFVVAATVT